jgi:hypothetical protein
MPELLARLGSLDVETVRLVVEAHLAIEDYCTHFRKVSLKFEGERASSETRIGLPGFEEIPVGIMKKKVTDKIDEAIMGLDRYVR